VNFSPNGKLSKDRFVAVYEQFYPGGKAKDFCKYAFSTFDRDNNGTSKINPGEKNLFIFVYIVDFTEFMLAIALTQSGDLDERLALAFDMYDYNNSGTSKLKLMGFSF
jgi:Ca2+-binding EF-hand superfamily protein